MQIGAKGTPKSVNKKKKTLIFFKENFRKAQKRGGNAPKCPKIEGIPLYLYMYNKKSTKSVKSAQSVFEMTMKAGKSCGCSFCPLAYYTLYIIIRCVRWDYFITTFFDVPLL